MRIDKRDVTTVGDKVQLTTIHKTRSDFSVIELQDKNIKRECARISVHVLHVVLVQLNNNSEQHETTLCKCVSIID